MSSVLLCLSSLVHIGTIECMEPSHVKPLLPTPMQTQCVDAAPRAHSPTKPVLPGIECSATVSQCGS